MNLAIVCVAAGRGERFGGDKLGQRLGGRTVLEISLRALRAAFSDAPLVVVVADHALPQWIEELGDALGDARLVAGGRRRQDSVRNGVEAAVAIGADVVAIHDAARPLVDTGDVRRTVESLGEAAGTILCAKVADTVKRVNDTGMIVGTVPREELRLAQTPQVFKVSALQQAWSVIDSTVEWTDEAAMVEAAGLGVKAVLADRPNPKLTTAHDLELLRRLTEKLS